VRRFLVRRAARNLGWGHREHTLVELANRARELCDLLLLPIKPGGVEHKHYNRYDDKPAKWIAFISGALFEWGASEMVQLENHPDFKSKTSERSAR